MGPDHHLISVPRSSVLVTQEDLHFSDYQRTGGQWVAVRGVVNVAEGQNNSRPQLSVHSAPTKKPKHKF